MKKPPAFEETMLDLMQPMNGSSLFVHWRAINEARRKARRFIIGKENSEFVLDTMRALGRDMILDNIEFALPPFENTFVEFRVEDTVAKRIGLLMDGKMMWFIYEQCPDETHAAYDLRTGYPTTRQAIGMSYWCYFFEDRAFDMAVMYDRIAPEARYLVDQGDQDVKSTLKALLLGMTFFLLLHKPGVITIHQNPYKVSAKKGRRVVYAAHSTISINLRDPNSFRRVLNTGKRETPRRHEVRGHFMHYHHDRSCSHDWVRVEPKETDAKEVLRWNCSRCETLRVWRPAFGRGDASKGFVTHDYRLT